jgi:CRISPR system Cascade subunit CasD
MINTHEEPRVSGDFLTCVLAAPLGAFGSLAVGERRGTWDRPGRSAVLGLIAACLGLERTDGRAHQALEADYGLALRVEHLGPVLADYHTAQAAPKRRGRTFRTRREELQVADLGTILSRRDYHTDVVVFVALWPRGDARWPLDAIAQAMREPQFTPYLGRRACPLMLPLSPEINVAVNPAAALAARAERDHGLRLLSPRNQSPGAAANPTITLDAADARAFGLAYRRVEIRRDALSSRRRWQYNLREEAVL